MRHGKKPLPPGKNASKAMPTFQGKLAESAKTLAACLKFDEELDLAAERLGTYAFLKTAEDTGESKYQRMQGRYMHAASQSAQAASFIRPEILAIPAAKMKEFLAAKELVALSAAARAAAAVQAAHAWARRKKNCWPCRPKCRRPPAKSSASLPTPISNSARSATSRASRSN